MGIKKITFQLTPQHGLALSFFALILVGSVLLSLPISTAAPHGTSFVDALFTATSAVCVTGLITVDTSSHWSLFGQIVILLLIQIGGLGIMTFSSFIILLFARRLSIWDRDIMQKSVALDQSQPLKHLLWAIFVLTLVFELVGAVILTLQFRADFPLLHAAYLGIFHAVSAFCNAGFSLFSSNLMPYQDDVIVNLTIMFLIILGGIGFWVLLDLKNMFKRKKSYHATTLHTRLVIYTSSALIAIGFIVFFLLEGRHAFQSIPLPGKLTAALFHAVTARTAGFNTIDITTFTNSSIFLLLILMLIGASPGSCGGGIKTSTFAILLAMIHARIKNSKQVQLFNRGVPDGAVSNAIGITAAALLVVSLFCFLLLFTENTGHTNIPDRTLFITVLFETVSAFGTVGLSLGLTPHLSIPGKLLIILLMYIGRIGPITLMLALTDIHEKNLTYAQENIWVG